tara:strand:- start:9 stop:335 length:327 start_codon:yes stop_codon:yes gene_type:complete
MYAIYKEVYLDKIYKTYENILIISAIPPNLNNMIRNIRLEKVSVHKPSFNCGYAFKSFLNSNKYMTIEELPNLISYLKQYNYEIDYEENKLLSIHMKSNFILSFRPKN